ncbi:GntR family transcriptional regulator [Paenirhodobacter hankyongi]|uniref:FCD domain-containing protein n=1 Tax=Paenirhodobacter hankyongi TaxID=2294033 RepID=A0A421BQP2_9RHOB|nr:FCD domain-containing protein [Sinirhodobacter hankyongi]RLL65280.1 FCD domain-containing protein [Sinirhodobacter hankyongi]
MQDKSPKSSLTAQITDDLRTSIVLGDFLPGTKLKIDDLALRFSSSTGIVREVLARLSAEGLVTALPQRGFIVSPISRDELTELTDARVDVERHCLTASIARGDVNWESELIAAEHRLAAATRALDTTSDREAILHWQTLHTAFHDALTSACGNRWWLRFRQQLFIQSERYRQLSGLTQGGSPVGGRDLNAEHAALMRAALDRDVTAAGDLIEAHLRKTAAVLMESERLQAAFVDAA